MSRWANRKAAVQAEAKAEQAAMLAKQHAALAERPEAEVLAELELPNPDEMQAGDDFSAFMKETVPAVLRNRALKRLWTSNPVLANVDMLVDYGEDFTAEADPVGIVKTIYRVGKGMLPDAEEVVEEAAVPEVVPEPMEEIEEEVVVMETAPLPEMEDVAPALAPRRRMRFEFEAGDMPSSTETETV